MWKWVGAIGLKAVPLPVWLGIGGLILAGVIGYGALMYARGVGAADVAWLRAKLGWERQQANDNMAVDKVTIQRDADVKVQLEELRKKWSGQ